MSKSFEQPIFGKQESGEEKEKFESFVSWVVEKFGDTPDTIKNVLELEQRAGSSEYKIQILSEALRRTTFKNLPELQEKLRKETEERRTQR